MLEFVELPAKITNYINGSWTFSIDLTEAETKKIDDTYDQSLPAFPDYIIDVSSETQEDESDSDESDASEENLADSEETQEI